jgi:hypothetical protein
LKTLSGNIDGAVASSSSFGKFRDRAKRALIGVACQYSLILAFDLIYRIYFLSDPEFNIPRLMGAGRPVGFHFPESAILLVSGALIGLAAAKPKVRLLEAFSAAVVSLLILGMTISSSWSGPSDEAKVFLALLYIKWDFLTFLPFATTAITYFLTRRRKPDSRIETLGP